MLSDSHSSDPRSISSTLLQRVTDRDPDAWRRVSYLYGPVIYGWARHAGLQASDANDVAQEVFATLAVRIDDFRRDHPGATFRGWLWGITRNKLREFARNHAKSPQAAGGTAALEQLHAISELPTEESVDFEQADTRFALMHRALLAIRDDFEEKTWQAFWRSAVNEEKAADIGDELEMTPRAVRRAKYRVQQRLRLEIDGLTQ